jgi:membrane protein implicated in regulation of membrane protease activity
MDSEAFAAVLIAAVLSLFLWSRQQQQSEEEPIGMRNRARQETEARVFFLEENLETS